MKGIVHQRSYDSVKRLSPKRRKNLIKKLYIRQREVNKTCKILFETGVLTYSMFNHLEKTYQALVNEKWKLEHFDNQKYINHHFSKTETLVHTTLGIQFTKEFKRKVYGKRADLFKLIKESSIEWIGGNKTLDELSRDICSKIEML